jgi:hypothetical protein
LTPPSPTERFYARYSTTGYATPRNPHLRARVTWNRVRSAEVDAGGNRSRVLLISGPPDVVNERFLYAYLDTKMVYQVDAVLHRGQNDDGSRVLVEFRFGSFRCQAEAARMALMREFRDVGVVCDYGETLSLRGFSLGRVWTDVMILGLDPCDVVPDVDDQVYGDRVLDQA